MKYLKNFFYPSIEIVLGACNINSDKHNTGFTRQVTDTTQPAKSKNKFADLHFASKKDTTCGMPITAGIADTLIVNGKVYGFCSTECKNDFVTILKKQHKQ